MKKRILASLVVVFCGALSLALAAPAKKPNRYIGSGKCKLCHTVPANGAQFDHWSKSKHAEAWNMLAGDAAKKVAAEKGIADPQKDEKCFKCHVTGFGLAAELFDKSFDKKAGVQCESCHGPGEQHVKARMAAAASEEKADPTVRKTVPEGEIRLQSDIQLCQTCHNKESPTYKAFCFHERLEKIAHYDPRGTRKPSGKMTACPCDDACECKKAACKDLPKK